MQTPITQMSKIANGNSLILKDYVNNLVSIPQMSPLIEQENGSSNCSLYGLTQCIQRNRRIAFAVSMLTIFRV